MFGDLACADQNEWTGAVAEVNNGTHTSLEMECCRSKWLAVQRPKHLKTIVLKIGERYTGGPMLKGEKGKVSSNWSEYVLLFLNNINSLSLSICY